MIAKPTVADLKPGDCLLYDKSLSMVDFVIRVKTWGPAAHEEVYIGDGKSIAARWEGVRVYPVRLDGLVAVLRPNKPVDVAAGMKWFNSMQPNGGPPPCEQAYDLAGLLVFTLAIKQGSPNKMFCSECGTRWFRASGFDAVHPSVDADTVAPNTNFFSPNFEWVYHV